MRIICPTCASHYEVDAGKIGLEGRQVRCAECRDVWLVRALEADVSAQAMFPGVPALSEMSPASRAVALPVGSSRDLVDFQQARLRLRPRREAIEEGQSLGRTLGSVTLGLACIGVVMAGLHFRAGIMHHLPGTAPAFAALGLGAGPERLALRDVRSQLVADGGKTVLQLQGHIANLGGGSMAVPAITVVVRDAAQTALYTWTTPAPKARLAKGESVEFKSRLAAPPSAGQDVRVSFAETGSLTR